LDSLRNYAIPRIGVFTGLPTACLDFLKVKGAGAAPLTPAGVGSFPGFVLFATGIVL
jgi:hypothetical protein